MPRQLTLFITGDAPCSRRARGNLAEVLRTHGWDPEIVRVVDLLADPTPALNNGIFASPAIMIGETAHDAGVMYGDLSEAGKLWRFLAPRMSKPEPMDIEGQRHA